MSGAQRHCQPVLGVAITAAGVAAAPLLLRGYGLLTGTLLAPPGHAELAFRVRQLTQTRTEALDTGAAEIRRIERDLHTASIFLKLNLQPSDDDNRRVLAVLAYLGG